MAGYFAMRDYSLICLILPASSCEARLGWIRIIAWAMRGGLCVLRDTRAIRVVRLCLAGEPGRRPRTSSYSMWCRYRT